ncbi:hypothetical protein M5X00_16685 [Paenibacillus alvei]|uniref:hypothetical protein n=1 Tax=Paenibacillus alvei TaxID=44250 RepID=UPI000289E757|nr:hypothetical protein [Paenibacillus alvei]EJW17596.1 hypothetical protein PAV_3c00410 [Paenibacillus alvei DSM 29]MCY9540571.1 hypothetical protein [Paenibacillus alvei]MCY9706972.1 hypothetical protein [Paenibacillus alvei]MCY9736058.1 hypothetical protein [Paenibacillus alvei]MCY9755878.1 hypothetical protein [Paenibacillus alvei]
MIQLNVLFKKMQKDDKKEVLVYEVKGDDLPQAHTLVEMAGTIVILAASAAGNKTSEIQAEFATLQRDSKKTALKFNIKGDNEKASAEFYRMAGMNVTLSLQASQMSIDEFYDDDHEGVQYTINPDGTVDMDPNQMTIDEAAAAAEHQQEEETEPDKEPESEKVADITTARKRRGRQKKEEQPAAPESSGEDELPPLASDDDLPF